MSKHTHGANETILMIERGGYVDCITPYHCNPSAHGGIRRREYCKCGAHRDININGTHREEGPWKGGN